MMSTPQKIHNAPENWNQFFYMYSRMEYALKASQYLQGGKEAKASWEKLASKANAVAVYDAIRLNELTEMLFREPPRKQIIIDRSLGWQTRGDEITDLKTLFRAVGTIRNNLFHGGKNVNNPDRARDNELIRAGIAVMEDLLELDPKLKENFCSVY